DDDRVDEPVGEGRLLEEVLEVHRARPVRDQRGGAQRAERVERRGHDIEDREQGEDAGSQRHQVAPADPREPRLTGHRLISSRAAVRRKPMIETVATIRKMSTDTAAANPYCAPPA